MQMSATITVAASAQDAIDVLAHEPFIAFASERSNMKVVSIVVDRLADGAVTSVVRREVKSDIIPANFRSFVGATIELRQTEAWAEEGAGGNAKRFGTFDLEIVGAPVRISGSMTLAQTDPAVATSELQYSGDIVCSIPFLGASIEKAVGGVIQEVLKAQGQLIDEWIAAQG